MITSDVASRTQPRVRLITKPTHCQRVRKREKIGGRRVSTGV